MVVNDYRTSPHTHPLFVERTGTAAILAEPLLYHQKVLGVIVLVVERAEGLFADIDRDLLALFAAQAAIAVENAQLHGAALRPGEKLGALLRATRMVMSGLDLEQILQHIVDEAAKIAATDHVKVLIVDQEAQVLRLGAFRQTSMPLGRLIPLGQGFSGKVAVTGEPLFSADTASDPQNMFAESDRDRGLVTYLGLPIKIRQEVLGVLTFHTTYPRQYSPEELGYLESFADQVAIALENARLYKHVEQRLRRLQTLTRLNQLISSSLNMDEVLSEIAQAAATLIDTPLARIWIAMSPARH